MLCYAYLLGFGYLLLCFAMVSLALLGYALQCFAMVYNGLLAMIWYS